MVSFYRIVTDFVRNLTKSISENISVAWRRCFKSGEPRPFSERRCGSISFSGMSEESVTEVTRELSSLGFEVWDTCLGDHGVTLAFT